MSFTSRQRVWIAGFVAVPMATIVLAACVPKPAPGPKSSAAVGSSSVTTSERNYWGSDGGASDPVGNKDRATTTTTFADPCDGSTNGSAVERCHLTYSPRYLLETTNNSAQATADFIAARITVADCQNQAILDSYHSGNSRNPGLNVQQKYGTRFASENLYCFYISSGACLGPRKVAARAAIYGYLGTPGWIHSPLHKANMDSIVSEWVNGGAACNPVPPFGTGQGVFVAVAQFHSST